MLLVVSSSVTFGAIPLNSPTTDWTAVTYIGSAQTDYIDDEQTGINESDLVGSAVGVTPVQTAFYFDYDGVLIGFRVRVDGDSNPPGFTGAIWVGLMLDGNDSVDLFAGVIDKGPTEEIGFYSPGTGANISPSTTSIEDDVAIFSQPISGSNYLYTAVTVGPSGNDPVTGGTSDVGGDGNTDYFVTWVLPFSELQASAASLGFTGITEDSQMRFVVGTSEQGNAMNQDLNGTSGNTTSTSTFTTLGAVSPTITAGGGVIPEPGTLSYAVVALGCFWMAGRRVRSSRTA